jgi:hypothetical protein
MFNVSFRYSASPARATNKPPAALLSKEMIINHHVMFSLLLRLADADLLVSSYITLNSVGKSLLFQFKSLDLQFKLKFIDFLLTLLKPTLNYNHSQHTSIPLPLPLPDDHPIQDKHIIDSKQKNDQSKKIIYAVVNTLCRLTICRMYVIFFYDGRMNVNFYIKYK